MRLLTVLFLVLTALSAFRLTHLRPSHEIFIQGRLTLASDEPVDGAEVDVVLVFPESKLKIDPRGRQFVALRTLGASEQWLARPDTGSYSIEWGPSGDFEVILKLASATKPRRCRLLYRLGGVELKSPRFRLRGKANSRDRWVGLCPDQVLAALPTTPHSSASTEAGSSEAVGAEETPEQDMSETGVPLAEDQEIGQRAELTLQRINTLSPLALRTRYQLLRYLEQHPVYARNSPNRTRRIGVLLRDILGRRLALLGILRTGEPVWVRPEVGLKLLWSDPDEHEAEESGAEDAEQDPAEVHQEDAPRFED